MYVIETWRRWLVGFAMVLIVERAPLDSTWSFFLTGLVFVVLAVLMYRDWRSASIRQDESQEEHRGRRDDRDR
jgi:hypothetical protein